ncbi:hypothetical protein CDL15_Pgr023161 [Punica granatum]|uniref:DYW domain-containing protein n=1 Tax=Punica granatum TaxID=22663 RepID=A0A218X4U5_PUNGR|nr:hypothetical protein CDL15_Pgr023161 [Punica granatum]
MLKLSPSFHPPPCAASPDPKQLHALSLKTATFALPSTSSKLISLYADPKTSNLDYALSVFDRAPKPTLLSWNVIIKCHVENHRSHDAISLFCELLHEFTPDSFTLPCVIKGCSRLGVVEEGKQLHGLAMKIGLGTDKFVQSSLVSMYAKCHDIGSARNVFDEMPEKDLVSWNSLIDGYARCGEVDLALEMDMRDLITWNSMIAGYDLNGKFKDAVDVFSEMLWDGFSPNRATLVSALSAVSGLATLSKGRWIHSYMVKNAFELDDVLGTSLIDMYSKCGSIESALAVFQSIQSKKLGHWTAIIVGLGMHGMAAGHWEKVSQVREMMKSKGISKDPGCSSIEHQGTLHEFIVGDKSHGQTRQIYWKLGEMREKLKKVGHVPDTSQVLLCIEGEEEKEAELETHSERLAIAFGLISIEPGIPIRIMKNLRVCNDCHSVTKLLSKIYNREITVRDNSRFHHFRNGSCSCNDFW